MKSRRSIKRNKKGSYIVEATIVVPIFIIAVTMLISIIPIISTCENITFTAADEIRLETAKTAFRDNPVACPASLKLRVKAENKKITSFNINGYSYRFKSNGINDLISVRFSSTFKEKNPLGLFSSVRFKGKIVGRAFTGVYYKDQPSERSEFEADKNSKRVYIFPKWGNCYHNKGCTYVKSNCHLLYLSQTVRGRFHACPLCGARNVGIGTLVFCFESSGDAYHLGNCKSVKKYYIDIEKNEAVKKGYMPCSKCGG